MHPFSDLHARCRKALSGLPAAPGFHLIAPLVLLLWAAPLLLLPLTALLSCSTSQKVPTAEKYVETREIMGTWATVTLITDQGGKAVAATEAAFAFLDSVNVLMNPRSEESEIYAVNRHAHERPVSVSAATFAVLQRAADYSHLSSGAFDVSVGPLIHLWEKCAHEGRLPGRVETEASRRAVGYEKITLEPAERCVRFQVRGMRVDLGGIAKGFAIDGAVEAILRTGVTAGIVEVGGDLRCFGKIPAGLIGKKALLPVRALRHRLPGIRPGPNETRKAAPEAFSGLRRTQRVPCTDPQPWPLGVQSPFGEQLLGKIRLAEGAVASSGHYRRYLTIAGRRFSHIIDPRTGWPVKAPASVTVIAGDALTADALATAITVLGGEAGLALAESLAGVEVLIVEGTAEEAHIRKTPGFPEMEALGP